MRKVCLLILLLGLVNFCYSQFPVGKNIEDAKTELRKFLKAKGFKYLKSSTDSKDMESIDFTDEFSIILSKNRYENVSYININTFRKKVFERLKTSFNFSSWKYLGDYPKVAGEVERVYNYKNYVIRLPYPDGNYQFIVRLNDSE
jgi:hypothetical protein